MDPSNIVDLSHKLDSDVQIYPDDPPFTCSPCATVAKDGYSVHGLTMGTHTGTHIDAPSHFFADGKTIDQIPLPSLFGPLVVVDLTQRNLQNRQMIIWADIEASADRMSPGVILLLHTGWSAHWGSPKYYEHPFLARDAAERIVERGVHIVGVDALSPDETPYQGVGGGQGFGAHEVILGAGGIIAENLTNLSALDGQNHIALVPLNLDGCDGSPVRAFAWKT
ncbi:hypothetical protein D9615_009136 [Tricholomella constricta]|uniref:Cyclase n=1 Tax=Tricholomella constricta TaxID=117010 RepID=A0A8H5H2S5_9AGAR|nr:hypothetical protein D9615_009136 [Tricholomella constricta]